MEAVRRAGQEDLERCRELLGQALANSRSQRGADLLVGGPGTDVVDLVSRWDKGEASTLLVGTYDEVVVGIAAGTVSTLGERRVGQVECFYVEPEARAVGVGGALVEGLVDWFAERNCSDVDAIALPGDRSSKQLLESAGFKARLLVLHRSLH
jgi:GNAT superfamily N-acetyltransferase